MASAFWKTVVRFDAGRIAPEIAVRNTIGIVAPLIAGAAAGNSSAGAVAALGALNVSYSDSREPYAIRARRMLLASVLVGIAVGTGALSARSDIAVTLASTVWAFGVGMLVVLGAKAGDLGAITLVSLIVFAARQLSPAEAVISGLLAFGGGLLQTALSVAVWPIKPYQPEKNTLGSLYRTLAHVAVSPAGAASAPPATAAVVSARESLASLESNPSREAERLIYLLSQAERIRLSVLTLRRLARRLRRDPQGNEPAEALDRVLETLSAALRTIGDSIVMNRPTRPLDHFSQVAREFQDRNREMPTAMARAMVDDAKHQVESLEARVRAAAGFTSPEKAVTVGRPTAARRQDVFGSASRLRANLSFRSAAFRHAVRLAVCVGLAEMAARRFNLERGYWLPMTVAIVLKPDFTATFSRGILRVGGTLVGLLIATVAYHLLPGGIAAEIALLAAYTVVLRGVGPANYGIFVTAISGFIVLLIALTGVNPKEAIVARAINTALGGALALFAYWAWPTWESTQAGGVLADMLDASRRYFLAVMTREADDTTDAVRNAARLARSNAEASVSRFAAEPASLAEQRTLLNEILVSSHVIARAAMAIESDPAPIAGAREAAHGFAEQAGLAMELMADSLRTGRNTPGGIPDVRSAWMAMARSARSKGQAYSLLVVETDRLATTLNTLYEQITKWNRLKRLNE